MNIQTFIFNWRNQYEKTKYKVAQLKNIGIKQDESFFIWDQCCHPYSSLLAFVGVPSQLPKLIPRAGKELVDIKERCPVKKSNFFKYGPTPASFSFIFLFLTKWNQTRIARKRVGRSIH